MRQRWPPVGFPPSEKRMRNHLQRVGNLFVIGLLRSPLHRLASGSLLLITYRGRRSGRRFTIPVMYAEREETLTIFVGHSERKRWWQNLRLGAEVEVRLRVRRLRAGSSCRRQRRRRNLPRAVPAGSQGDRGSLLAHLRSRRRADAEQLTSEGGPRCEARTAAPRLGGGRGSMLLHACARATRARRAGTPGRRRRRS